jgi:hypothetical protein
MRPTSEIIVCDNNKRNLDVGVYNVGIFFDLCTVKRLQIQSRGNYLKTLVKSWKYKKQKQFFDRKNMLALLRSTRRQA